MKAGFRLTFPSTRDGTPMTLNRRWKGLGASGRGPGATGEADPAFTDQLHGLFLLTRCPEHQAPSPRRNELYQ